MDVFSAQAFMNGIANSMICIPLGALAKHLRSSKLPKKARCSCGKDLTEMNFPKLLLIIQVLGVSFLSFAWQMSMLMLQYSNISSNIMKHVVVDKTLSHVAALKAYMRGLAVHDCRQEPQDSACASL